MRRKLRGLKWAFIDVKSQLLRNRVPPHDGLEQHGLCSYNVYPQGGNLNPDFFANPRDQYPRIIGKDTPIASIGSCFAVEIKRHLQEKKFNSISTTQSMAGSAEWGRVYTTKNMLQIFQYTFTEFVPEIRLCRNDKGFFDPYREGRFYATEEEAEKGIAQHHEESLAALTSCEVLVVTPGQNEAWVNASDGMAWVHKPPAETFASYGGDSFYVKRFSLTENIDYLNRALELFWENNPTARVICTVSPVPSHATFHDANVAVRSFENKAILLLAVKEVIDRHPGRTYYFPSFEMSILSHNLNLQLDNRHVRPRVVDRIMDCFDKCFVTDP